MQTNGYGRVVNVSSEMGQLSDMGVGTAAYRISKTALNALTTIFAAEVGRGNIKINCCTPGWVRTDMGGADGDIDVQTSVAGMRTVMAGLSAADNGSFINYDGERLSW